MIGPEDIRELRTAATDHAETEALKARMRVLRAQRHPFFLEREELDAIFRWKLRGQYLRVQRWFTRNTEQACRDAIRDAFAIQEEDPARESEMRLTKLMGLWGVGTPVASAVLALVDPERHCVVDVRGWRQVFGEERREFGPREYVLYREQVARIAAKLGWSVQETDLAIWEYDRRCTKAAAVSSQSAAPSAAIASPGPATPRISVAIADSSPIMRDALRAYLAEFPDLYVVGRAADGQEAFDLVKRTHVDVLLLAMLMPSHSAFASVLAPNMTGYGALPEIRRISPRTQVIVLSWYPASVAESAAMEAGAFRYLCKETAQPQEIVQAIREAVRRPSTA